ncbi:hypothetical protein PISMIDRAFT_255030 [Pisolithus microcarpus 441]|uniref:Uncharacterized protein n=1 Tax=Pisolithus microcarpus 441 TaxID=765257 RepID=A0A0C9Z9R7_9AGAM|nr:hypothetical protein BKA83DRAFT_255030 [Pisolithus microcarpus]KIK16663.1 hypothetical protein PISMIDRAFT_255030 [Pisolithus microcarpus 441]
MLVRMPCLVVCAWIMVEPTKYYITVQALNVLGQIQPSRRSIAHLLNIWRSELVLVCLSLWDVRLVPNSAPLAAFFFCIGDLWFIQLNSLKHVFGGFTLKFNIKPSARQLWGCGDSRRFSKRMRVSRGLQRSPDTTEVDVTFRTRRKKGRCSITLTVFPSLCSGYSSSPSTLLGGRMYGSPAKLLSRSNLLLLWCVSISC